MTNVVPLIIYVTADDPMMSACLHLALQTLLSEVASTCCSVTFVFVLLTLYDTKVLLQECRTLLPLHSSQL